VVGSQFTIDSVLVAFDRAFVRSEHTGDELQQGCLATDDPGYQMRPRNGYTRAISILPDTR
jgi:hypothetical protein